VLSLRYFLKIDVMFADFQSAGLTADPVDAFIIIVTG